MNGKMKHRVRGKVTTRQFLAIAVGVLRTGSGLSGPAEIVIPAIITPQTTDPFESWLAADTS
jgi:glucoamylase